MPGTAVYRIAGVLAARRLLQQVLVQIDVGEFREIGFRFVLRNLESFREFTIRTRAAAGKILRRSSWGRVFPGSGDTVP